MRRIRKKQSRPTTGFTHFIRPLLREVGLLAIAGLSLFLLLALFTYNSADPSWSHTGLQSEVTNAGGRAGAWVADFLLYLMGYLAYLLPILLLFSVWRNYQQRKQATHHPYLWAVRVVGIILVLIGGTGLATLWGGNAYPVLPFTSGGIIGEMVSLASESVFSVLGTSLVLLVVLLSGSVLFLGWSWLSLLETIGDSLLRMVTWLGNRWQAWRQERIERASQAKPKQTKAPIWQNKVTAQTPSVQPTIVKPEPLVISPKIVQTSALKPTSKSNLRPVQAGAAPSLQLLDQPTDSNIGLSQEQLDTISREVENRLLEFGIESNVVGVHPGPVVTRFELELAPGLKVNKLTNLVKDIARSLSVTSVRVVEVIPGKSVVGLEIPNADREVVRLSEVISSSQYADARSPLSLGLGKDIAGHPVVVDLGKMPHLLVAGTTGSGKSVGINAMLLSMLYKSGPDQVRFILIDPKMLELSVYQGIPHLLTPVVTDMREAANALRWCVGEMERRYRIMAALAVRNLAGCNEKIKQAEQAGKPLLDPLWQAADDAEDTPPTLETLPYIVVVIEELADMMLSVGKKVEDLIARIAQKARAAGIHLILATQRPSVDVITGLVKANIPTRISFQVSSKIDSRTILDQQGAEQLLGEGDMLYLPPGSGLPVRVHGAYIDDKEVHRVVKELRKQGEPVYLMEVTEGTHEALRDGLIGDSDEAEADPLYDQAVQIVIQTRRASISSVQRRLKIGYNRAARLVEQMEVAGIVSAMGQNGAREVLAPPGPSE